MTHTVHMDLPIRPGDARRLGLRRPPVRIGHLIQIDRPLTDAEAADLRARWEAVVAKGQPGKILWPTPPATYWPLPDAAPQLTPRRRWWQRRNR